MKTSLPKLAFAALCLGLLTAPTPAPAAWNQVPYLTWKEGQLVLVGRGRTAPVDSPVTLADGTLVTPDGYYRRSGGYRTPLYAGEIIALDGIVLNPSTLPRSGWRKVVRRR